MPLHLCRFIYIPKLSDLKKDDYKTEKYVYLNTGVKSTFRLSIKVNVEETTLKQKIKLLFLIRKIQLNYWFKLLTGTN